MESSTVTRDPTRTTICFDLVPLTRLEVHGVWVRRSVDAMYRLASRLSAMPGGGPGRDGTANTQSSRTA
jgi:hypothetical protein